MENYYDTQRAIEQILDVFIRQLNENLSSEFPGNLAKLLRCAHSQLWDPQLSIGQLLEDCDIRTHTFAEQFRRHCGVSLRTYIEEKRLEAAIQLMERTEADLLSIAFAVGFASYRTFLRAFDRRKNCSPSAYREKVTGGNVSPMLARNGYDKEGSGS